MDNTAQGGADTIATDDLATLNGAASSGVKVQRVKPVFGVDSDARDVSGAFPFPVTLEGGKIITFNGRASSFRIPGRAGTTGQKLFSIFNTVGSGKLVEFDEAHIHLTATVIKAVTVLPPVMRLYRVTAAPTNGTAATKVSADSTQSSSTSVAVLFDASADGTSSTTALTSTLTVGVNVITGQFAARMITAAGFDMIFKMELLSGEDEAITLREGEGIVGMLDYTLATQNPVTDMWLSTIDWKEYTLAP
jgi:hypothetical protein